MSMSDKKLNSLRFLFDPHPLPLKTKVTKIEKFCNVSVNTHDIDSITTKINSKENLTTSLHLLWRSILVDLNKEKITKYQTVDCADAALIHNHKNIAYK